MAALQTSIAPTFGSCSHRFHLLHHHHTTIQFVLPNRCRLASLSSNHTSWPAPRFEQPWVLCRRRRRPLSVRAADSGVEQSIKPAITLSEKALKHLRKMRAELNQDLYLRIGVRQGGCSGMSYIMDFEQQANVRSDDSLIDYEGFAMVCDPKSLLFLYGMQLDYSDALIGGGFSFSNPNATSTCGCGKSFAA